MLIHQCLLVVLRMLFPSTRKPANEGTTFLLCHTHLSKHNSAVPAVAQRLFLHGFLSVQEANGKANRHAAGKGKNPAKQHFGFRTESLQTNTSGLIGTGRNSSGECAVC